MVKKSWSSYPPPLIQLSYQGKNIHVKMDDSGPVSRGKARRARDSLELTKQRENLYPNLDSENDSEDNYCARAVKGSEEVTAQQVGFLKDQSESEPECSDEESDAQSTGDDENEEELVESEEPLSFKDSTCFKIIMFVVLLLPVFIPLLQSALASQFCSFSFEKMLEDELEAMPLLSINKKSEIKQNIIAKIDSAANSDPLAIFIMSGENHQLNATLFARNIAHIFSKCCSSNLKSSESLSYDYLHNQQDNLDFILDQKMESAVSAIVVEDFTSLPWKQAKLFLKYCDNENAPYKDRLFMFTSVVGDCDPLRPDKSAETALLESWSEEEETIEALAVRVSAISVCIK